MVIMGYDAILTHAHYTRGSVGLRRVGSAAIRSGQVVSQWPVAERSRPPAGSERHRRASMVSRLANPGRRGLKGAGRAGRKPRLDRAAWARVERALLQGAPAHGFATDLWTLPRVATVIARLTGERFHPGHVRYLLRALNCRSSARDDNPGNATRPP
jgi:hypothetical protein